MYFKILKPAKKLNYPEFVMHAYGEDANDCLKDVREEFMGSITKVRVFGRLFYSLTALFTNVKTP